MKLTHQYLNRCCYGLQSLERTSMKRNKWELLVTSLVTLSPIVIGLCLYGSLPEKIAMHFDYQGMPDMYYDRIQQSLFYLFFY